VVVKATEKKDGRNWAIKIVDKNSTGMSDMRGELSIMSKLAHENIVTFKEVFDHPEGYYVVLELISGGELFDRIIELKRFTEKDAAQTMIQAFRAIEHMHEANLVHRDIKPENLLLSDKSATATIKLADFGFATTCDATTQLSDLLGTPEYMAPELVSLREVPEGGYGGYGRTVDIWALGVVLYILLSGIHPFQIEDEEQMMNNIQAGKWKWLGRNWDKVSEEAKDLITKMLDPNPKTRPTVKECLAHPWFKTQVDVALDDVAEEIKKFQSRKKLKGAINTVIASNKMRQLMKGALGAAKK
jgi:serine/threonine protein kinase